MEQVTQAAYRAAREAAVWAPAPDLAAFSVRGPDRESFLHGLLSSDVRALAAGEGQPSCLLTPKGRVVADLCLYRRAEDYLGVCPAAAVPGALRILAHMSGLSESRVEDLSPRTRLLRIAGPRAGAALGELCPAAAAGPALFCRAAGAAAGPAWLLGHPGLGPGGRLLLLEGSRESAFGAELLRLGVALADARTIETLRVEAGVPRAGVDYDADAFPQELNLGEALSFDKGCYLGQETIAHIQNRGHLNRRLAGVRLGGEAAPGDALLAGAESVGRLTSVVFSPRLGSPLGLGFVRPAHAAPGARLAAATRAGEVPAEVVALPLEGR